MKPHRYLAVLSALLLPAVPATAGSLRNLAESFPVGGARAVHASVTAGALKVAGTDGGEIRAEVEASCSFLGGETCREAVEHLGIAAQLEGGEVTLKLSGLDGESVRGLSVDWYLEVPHSLDLTAEVAVGDVRVTSMTGSVDLSVGVGRVEVLAAEAAVGQVHLNSGVGDVDLLVKSRSVEEGGLAFVGRRLVWEAGRGKAEIAVDCGVGRVRVSLD